MSRQVALALSGGGARGMAHIGVIRELLSHGFSIHSIAGCSIGSVVGAMYAMGKLQEFTDFILADGAQSVFSQLDFTFSDQGFIKGEKLIERLQEFAPDCNMEDLPVKLVIVATDMYTGNDVVYETGSVYRAIRASVAIPAVITAVHEDGCWLVDGGVVNPLPLLQLHRSPNDLLVAVNLYASPVFETENLIDVSDAKVSESGMWSQVRARWADLKAWRGNLIHSVFDDTHKKMGYFTTLRLMSELASKRLAEITIKSVPVDVLIEIPIASCGLFSFDKSVRMIRMGEEHARKALEIWKNSQLVEKQPMKRPFDWRRLFRVLLRKK